MLMSIKQRAQQRGIGLLELMLALGIIAVLLLMATRYYKSADQGQKVTNAISLVTGIAGAGSQYLSTHPKEDDKDKLSLKILVDDGYLSADFRGITHPWGGAILVAPGANNSVEVTLKAVPKGPCHILASSFGDASCDEKDVVVRY